jgi:hypothetical protein
LPIKLPNISHMSSPFYWLDHLSCWLHQFSPHVCCLHSHCWFDSTTKWIFHSSNLSIYPVHGYIYIYRGYCILVDIHGKKWKRNVRKCFGTRSQIMETCKKPSVLSIAVTCPRFHPCGPCAMSLAKHDLRFRGRYSDGVNDANWGGGTWAQRMPKISL